MQEGLIEPGLLRRLKDENETRVVPPGEVIVKFQSYIKSIPIILRGHVKVTGEDDSGNEILLYYLSPGDSCVMSVLGALNGSMSKIQATTVEETEILFIRPERAATLVREQPGWAEYIFKLYQSRFEELLEAVTRVNFKKLDDRILELLKQKSKIFMSTMLPVTHQELADELGSPREAISRVLKKLENEGLLKLYRGKIKMM
ncbi:MAG: Crp/Fnr family transcriptional regulator [Saprospiraceae bacterium]|nr:Crp/Fnr family transcriptional regulator [Saprospiraceae bacterium]